MYPSLIINISACFDLASVVFIDGIYLVVVGSIKLLLETFLINKILEPFTLISHYVKVRTINYVGTVNRRNVRLYLNA